MLPALAFPAAVIGLVGSLLLGSMGLNNLTDKQPEITYYDWGNEYVEIFINDGENTFISGVETDGDEMGFWCYMGFLNEKGERVNVWDANNGFGYAYDENDQPTDMMWWEKHLTPSQRALFEKVMNEIMPNTEEEKDAFVKEIKKNTLSQRVNERWFKEVD